MFINRTVNIKHKRQTALKSQMMGKRCANVFYKNTLLVLAAVINNVVVTHYVTQLNVWE